METGNEMSAGTSYLFGYLRIWNDKVISLGSCSGDFHQIVQVQVSSYLA
jgi:hypothetical protein